MDIIRDVERSPRLAYGGAFGWLGRDGQCELSVVIRSVQGHGDLWEFNVGGGILHGASSQEEYEETTWKASVVLDSFRAAHGFKN
jgi:anthranilate/para-aminobenzoate synthase component I